METKTPAQYSAIEPKEQVNTPISYTPIGEYESHAGPSDLLIGTSVSTSDASVRAAFIHKVYGILAMQLALTTAVCSLFMYVPPLRNFIIGLGSWTILLLCIVNIAVLVGCFMYKHSSPANVGWLAAFTLITSLMVACVCAQYQAAGLGVLILEALGLTLGIFVVLTAYTLISKKDFSFMGGMLFVGLWVLIGASFVNFIFGVVGGTRSPFLSMLIACGGAFIFSLYILYDSTYIFHISGHFPVLTLLFVTAASRIMLKLSVDAYVEAAIELYLDVINLFLYILQILSTFARD